MLCDAFAAVLRADRPQFNALFEHARRSYPALEREAFTAFLTQCADPLLRGVHAREPARVADAARVAFELGLELVGRQLAGPQARSDAVDQLWQRVLCAAASLVAADPLRLISALSNAAHNLAQAADVRRDAWIERMTALAPRAADAEALLRLGQVLAWQCGMAHYRDSALDAADRLPPALALAAVDADSGSTWAAESKRLRRDPWYAPGSRRATGAPLMRAGSFRGFGGLFPQPPQVMAQSDQLYVRSGDGYWQLMADACGATFVSVGKAGIAHTFAPATTVPAGIALPDLMGAPTSVAVTATTIAVTGSYMHAVLLGARHAARA